MTIDHPLAWLAAPCVMGILNATPDSFSDGGLHLGSADARARLRTIGEQGAAICDVGAESTRPGADPVSADEQLRRLEPILTAMTDGAGIPVSIDTASARVAAAALDAGAVVVNDVTAGRGDPDLLGLAADRGAGLCLMHMRGAPRTMQDAPRYDDVVDEVTAFLAERLDVAVRAGVSEDLVLLDPGIGFGKRLEHNLALLAGLDRIAALGRPVLVGVSRKRMVGDLLGREVGDRLAGSLALALAATSRGASVLRVHDVRETVDAVRAWRAVNAMEEDPNG